MGENGDQGRVNPNFSPFDQRGWTLVRIKWRCTDGWIHMQAAFKRIHILWDNALEGGISFLLASIKAIEMCFFLSFFFRDCSGET